MSNRGRKDLAGVTERVLDLLEYTMATARPSLGGIPEGVQGVATVESREGGVGEDDPKVIGSFSGVGIGLRDGGEE